MTATAECAGQSRGVARGCYPLFSLQMFESDRGSSGQCPGPWQPSRSMPPGYVRPVRPARTCTVNPTDGGDPQDCPVGNPLSLASLSTRFHPSPAKAEYQPPECTTLYAQAVRMSLVQPQKTSAPVPVSEHRP